MRNRRITGLTWPLVLLALPGTSLAQETSSETVSSRSQHIEQERQQKASHLQPDSPDKVERDFHKGERLVEGLLLTPHAGIRPKFSSSAPGWSGLASGSGSSMGPEYCRPDWARGEMVFRASVIGTVKHSYLMDTQLTFPRLANDRIVLDFLGRYRAERSLDYYGPGPRSLKGNRTDYSRESSEFNLRMGWKPAPRNLQVGVQADLLLLHVGPEVATGVAPIGELFVPSQTPGIQQQPRYLWGGPYVEPV